MGDEAKMQAWWIGLDRQTQAALLKLTETGLAVPATTAVVIERAQLSSGDPEPWLTLRNPSPAGGRRSHLPASTENTWNLSTDLTAVIRDEAGDGPE